MEPSQEILNKIDSIVESNPEKYNKDELILFAELGQISVNQIHYSIFGE